MIAEPVSDYINLLDPATKEVVGAVSPIYVYDSAEMPNVTFDNDMVIELRADGDYELTIVVDEAFLSDAETVYPVFVYPTVTVDVSGEGYKEIEDLGIYNTGAGNTPTGVARQIFFALGQNDASGAGRLLMRFPGVSYHSELWNITPSNITNATLYLTQVTIRPNTITMGAYRYTGGFSWTEFSAPSEINWNGLGTLIGSVAVGSTEQVSINITSAVREWVVDWVSADRGLILRNNSNESNTTFYKMFQTTRPVAMSKKPFVTITYTDPFDTAEAITAGVNRNVNVTIPERRQYYSFTPTATGFYTFESVFNGLYGPRAWLYGPGKSQWGYDGTTNGVNQTFRIVYHLDAGQKYFIAAGLGGTGTGSYQFKVTRTTNISNVLTSLRYSNLDTGYTTNYRTINISQSRARACFVYTASESGTYIFESFGNGSSDPFGWLYNSNGNLIASNDDGAGSRNFRIIATLSAGQTVYLVAGCYANGTGSFSAHGNRRTAVTVNNYFDNGYILYHYGSQSTANTTAARNAINGYTDALATRYHQLFGLQLQRNNATYYQSAIDTCKGTVTSSNINTFCSHTNPHTVLFNKHGLATNPNIVSTHFNDTISPSGSNILTNAYWSGHRVKLYPDSGVSDYNRSASAGTRGIYMVERTSSRLQGVQMHEMNHQLGAPDHYHELLPDGSCKSGDICSVCGRYPSPSNCIMNTNYTQSITLPTIVCSGCKYSIKIHLVNHHGT